MTYHAPNNDTKNPVNPVDPDLEANGAAHDGPQSLADAAANAGLGEPAAELDPLEAQKERYLRLAAEYDNYRKRTAKEAQQAAVRGQADLLRGLLDTLDDISRFAHVDPATTDTATVVHGVELVEKNLSKALANIGVEVIDPVEMPFDPNLHEAVSTIGTNSPDEDHIVAQVYQRGYMLKGQLLRPARVLVKQYQ